MVKGFLKSLNLIRPEKKRETAMVAASAASKAEGSLVLFGNFKRAGKIALVLFGKFTFVLVLFGMSTFAYHPADSTL